MNAIRQWIVDLLDLAKKRAVLSQAKRQLDERLFVFAIEIGRGKRLLPRERAAYTKTFRTAQIYLLFEEDLLAHPPKFRPFKNIIREPEEEWLLKEPIVKTELEHRLRHPLSDLEQPVFPPSERAAILRYLHLVARECPNILPREKLRSIVERLDHPLDRA